jgi:hypothetical protein
MPPPRPAAPEFRSWDGRGNNTANPTWGSASTQYLRETSGAAYTDGLSMPPGARRPSARVISNVLSAQGDQVTADSRGLSTAIYEFGQFLDHDLGLALSGSKERFDIAVPDQRRQLFTQSRVHLVKDSAGLRIGLGQGLAHPDGLGPLARKYIGTAHVILPRVWMGLPNTALARNAPTCIVRQNRQDAMHPALRKILYAVAFETGGIIMATGALRLMSDAGSAKSFSLAVFSAAVALSWSFLFNTAFEAWETRQTTKGRSPLRRTVHAVLFEGGNWDKLVTMPLTTLEQA